jgi:hypothetical protein
VRYFIWDGKAKDEEIAKRAMFREVYHLHDIVCAVCSPLVRHL